MKTEELGPMLGREAHSLFTLLDYIVCSNIFLIDFIG